MTVAGTPVRSLSPERYPKCFETFVARSAEYPAMMKRLTDLSASLSDGFSCLDVGAGTGKVIVEWMAVSAESPGRYVAMEPDPDHVARLRQRVASLPFETEVIEAAFDPNEPLEGPFDLILFSHSLYAMPDPAGCVLRAREALSARGRVVAFLQAPFGIHAIHRLFEPRLRRDRPPVQDQGVSSMELVEGLRAAGVEPSVEVDPTPIDLTGLFDPGHETELDDFISFCLQIEFSETPEPLRSDVLGYLRDAAVETGARLLWYEPTATVSVPACSGG